MADVYFSDKDGKRINPTFQSCPGGGSAVVEIDSSAGQGPDQACRYCRLQSRTGNDLIRVRIGSACTDETGVALPSYPTLTPYAVNNLNLLYFYGETNGNEIDIEYFD